MTQTFGIDNLNVWRKSMDYAVWICKDVLPLLPKEERFALVDQLRRSAQSIPANIAEGFGRFYYQENIRFCYIARGSLEETHSHLAYAREMNYLSNEVSQRGDKEFVILRQLISGYISYLKKNRPGSKEPGAAIYDASREKFIADTSSDDEGYSVDGIEMASFEPGST